MNGTNFLLIITCLFIGAVTALILDVKNRTEKYHITVISPNKIEITSKTANKIMTTHILDFLK